MKKISLLFTLLFSVLLFSQIRFEKAYFINNAGERIDCLIKNADWKNNPTEFEYKLTETSPIRTANITDVDFFEIPGESKYVRKTVQIDKSLYKLDHMSRVKDPQFVEEQLFLKELVGGKATLYKYQNVNLLRFFMQVEGQPIEQLVYKPYELEKTEITYNRYYQEQLKNSLTCNGSGSKINQIEYKEKPLTGIFIDYNNCNNPGNITVTEKKSNNSFHVNIRPRVSLSSLTLENATNNITSKMDIVTSIGAGLELEYVLPFNRNKWSLIVEPTYHSYNSQKIQDVNFLVGGKLINEVNLESIEIPIGARYYMFINEKSRIFINLQYVIDIALDSSINSTRDDGSLYKYTKIGSTPGVALGVGYNYNTKFAAEIRQLFHKNDYDFWTTKYNTTSLIFSYTIF